MAGLAGWDRQRTRADIQTQSPKPCKRKLHRSGGGLQANSSSVCTFLPYSKPSRAHYCNRQRFSSSNKREQQVWAEEVRGQTGFSQGHGFGDGCAYLGPGMGLAAPEILGMTTCEATRGSTGGRKRSPARAWRSRVCLCAGVWIARPG